MRILPAALLAIAAPAPAAEISTHVLDLAAGVGRRDVPVTLSRRAGDGWTEVARAHTDAAGRVRSFGETARVAGTYRLHFDMAAASAARPFFPEIDIAFEVTDPAAHYHVPVAVSPFGYSTYRGN